MSSFTKKAAIAATLLFTTALALDGIVAPSQVEADKSFNITFLNANSDQYRIYLAAALAGVNGPTCYLINTTTASSPITLSIPAGVGPPATYYSIAIADLITAQGATYSNRFNLTGATGNYTAYENHLNGSPFWSPNDLPCAAYSCARTCADDSYPADLTQTKAYDTMRSCILKCQGVTPAASQTAPAHASATGSGTTTGSSTTSGAAGAATTSSSAVSVRQNLIAGAAAAGFAGLAFML